MKRAFLFSALLACMAVTAIARAADKPNIVFIISDDHRWDCMGVAGNPHVSTPNLDRMAREGQWYRDFIIQIPTCSPSRSAILTGMPPYSNGWYSNEYQRKDVIGAHGFDQYDLLPKRMQAAGYHTALTGKWHITPDPWLCGFQTIKRWMLGGAGPYTDPRLAEGPSRDTKVVPGFTQTIFADDAVSIINSKASGETTQPLFLWVAFTAPHGPFGPNPQKFDDMYKGKSPRELAPPTYYDKPAKANAGRQSWASYYASISALDEQVGRIMDSIRNSPLADNTLVVFMGDNGFMMGRRDMQGKYVAYEDSLRVPMITWGPANLAPATNTTVTASLNSLDLPPTFVSLAGGQVPESWTGRDFTATLRDGQEHDMTYGVSAYPDNMSLIAHVKAYRVIRTPEHKLILWHPDAQLSPELYDLQNDPAENTNLFDAMKPSEAQEKLNALLTDYRKRTGDDQWDMKGVLGMFEPERLKWKTIDSGPMDRKPGTSATKEASEPRRKGKRRAQQ